MLIDKQIKQLLDQVAKPYQIIKKRDHYFLYVPGYRPIIVAGNSKSKYRNVKYTVHELTQIINEQRGM